MKIKSKNNLVVFFDTLIQNPNKKLLKEIALKKGPPPSSYTKLFDALIQTQESNVPHYMSGKCGQTSLIIRDILNTLYPEIDCLRVTANAQNGAGHIYNLLKMPNQDILIVDGSAAQFFTRPTNALNGKSYFIGTRKELKNIVTDQQQKAWHFVQSQTEHFKTLNHLDYTCRLGKAGPISSTASEIIKQFHNAANEMLYTEYLGMGWESTWGDQSRPAYGITDIAEEEWNDALYNNSKSCLLLPDPREINTPKFLKYTANL